MYLRIEYMLNIKFNINFFGLWSFHAELESTLYIFWGGERVFVCMFTCVTSTHSIERSISFSKCSFDIDTFVTTYTFQLFFFYFDYYDYHHFFFISAIFLFLFCISLLLTGFGFVPFEKGRKKSSPAMCVCVLYYTHFRYFYTI